jgi:UDP-GlcNAc:undecaprenyl-phosphate GlcNAc-1-phosphate transferase
MIWVYAAGLCMAFSLGVVLTPLVRRVALRAGAVDTPDGGRKLHERPTASMGGLAVAGAFFLTLAGLRFVFPAVEQVPVLRLLWPSLAILAVGVWDDLRPVKPRYKLLMQCAAAVCFYAANLRLDRILGRDLPVWLSLPATIFWLVACANAMNLFDGLDGLAAGLSVFVGAAFVALAAYVGKVEIAIASAALAGASLGFLMFNFPPAVIFLGDTGSLFLGMTFGALAFEGSFKSHLAFALIVPVLALGLPIMDTLLAIMRRVSRRASVFTADKEHIHHRLVALGFTRRQALLLLYAASATLASLSLLIAFSESRLTGLLILIVGLLIALGARYLGTSEVGEFGAYVMSGFSGRRAVPATRDRRPRIAFLTPLPTPYRQPLLERLAAHDSMDLVVYYLAESEADRAWDVSVPENEHFRVLPGEATASGGRKTFFNHWNPGLSGELDRGDYDAIVVPGYAMRSSQAAILWARRRRKPYVIHSESHFRDERRALIRRVTKAVGLRPVISGAAACLATGTLSREYLCRYGARPERVFYFPNTPDVEWFAEHSDELRPRRAELRAKWGLPDAPTVLFAGRLIQVKGVDVLLRAFAELRKRLGEASLAIVGDGPEKSRLEGLARELGVADGVHFIPFQQRDALVELYACVDVFCLPSRHEPWGVVVNEAAACGLPLVVSDRVGAAPDLVKEGRNGRVVPAEDASALAEALLEMLKPSADRDEMARVSREAARAWGYDFAFEQFGDMVRCVLDTRGGART